VGGWRATRTNTTLRLAREGDGRNGTRDDDLDALRALCALAWNSGSAESEDATIDAGIDAGDPAAAAVLEAFGLVGR
jgi:hypothetical protein